MPPTPYPEFPKIPRLQREIMITEKLDGTNGLISISEDSLSMRIGSRTRWISPESDNYGFAKWATTNQEALLQLGPGLHYGEWWGCGIQRGYGLKEKRFSLFNAGRWGVHNPPPACCGVVPVIYQGPFSSEAIECALSALRDCGSIAAPGFMNPEGICIYHVAAQQYFKQTLEKDSEWKGRNLAS